MRISSALAAAGMIFALFAAVIVPANALPAAAKFGDASASPVVEKVGYYRGYRGYGGYGYYQPRYYGYNGYYRPRYYVQPYYGSYYRPSYRYYNYDSYYYRPRHYYRYNREYY